MRAGLKTVRGRAPRLAVHPWVMLPALLATGAITLTACDHKPTIVPDQPTFVTKGDQVVVPAGSALRTQLVIAPVVESGIVRSIDAPAIVEANPASQNRILTPLSGRIAKLMVRLGDRVRTGQVLAVIAAPDLSAALADESRARSQVRLTATARDRVVGVHAIGGASDKDVQQAQADFLAAQAEAVRTATRLRQIGAARSGRGGNLMLTAPAGGIVTDLAAAPGQFWTDPTAPLMTVAGIGTILVTANVTEADLGSVRVGQPASITFTAYPKERIAGRVQSVAPLLDPDTRRGKVRIAIDNPEGRFKPGMFATVGFAAQGTSAPTVPDHRVAAQGRCLDRLCRGRALDVRPAPARNGGRTGQSHRHHQRPFGRTARDRQGRRPAR